MAENADKTEASLSYAIIGVGGVGGFYGPKLVRSGADVHFLLHSDADHVKEHGLVLESPEGDIRLPRVNAYSKARDMPQCDVVCVCLKTIHNHILPEILSRVVRPGALVLTMQNGLGVEEDMASIVPEAKVAGAACFLCSNKIGPGHTKHLGYGQVSLAGLSDGIRPLLGRIADDFKGAGIGAEVLDDLQLMRWRKLVWNTPYNGLTVALGTTTDTIMGTPSLRGLCEDIMMEVITAAEACGCPVGRPFVDLMLEMTDKMTPYKPSMKLDFDAGRPMELEYLYRRPIQRAREAGAPMYKTEALCAMLEFLDA